MTARSEKFEVSFNFLENVHEIKYQILAALASKSRRMVPEMEIGTAVLHATTELWCNPEQSAMNSLLARDEPSSSQLRITKSKVLVPDSMHCSDLMGPPSPKRLLRKITISKPLVNVDTVDLDSDNDEETTERSNKENIPEETVEIPETQVDSHMEVELSQNQYSELPTIEESFESALSRQEVDESQQKVIKKQRMTRSSIIVPEEPNKTSATTIKLISNASVPMSNNDLFNFTSSVDGSLKNSRKRKNSEAEELPVVSTSKKVDAQKPNNKKSRVDDSVEEAQQVPKQKPSRKRAADNEICGLFSFNTSFAKRVKPAEVSQDANKPSGIVAFVAKPHDPSPVKKVEYDSYDSGVWLSKAMISMNLNELKKGVEVKVELDTSFNVEDVKPTSCATLFSVLENSNSTTSSIISKRKQFVKKRNFKPQTSIVNIKIIKVEDTMILLDRF